MNFIKRVLSTVTGIFVFLFICFLGLSVIGLVLGASSNKAVVVKPNAILDLKLDFPIMDYAGKIEFEQYPMLNESKKNGLFNIIDAISYAMDDDNIKGISIDNNFISAGVSQTKALRGALLKFKESGKFIVAYGDMYSQKDYYLSSVADTIYLNPAGALEFKGLQTERLYYKDFQEKTGLKMEVIRLGKYKSAVEPFLSNEMSANNREQISVYLSSLWNTMKEEISEARKIPENRLDVIADSLLARNPELAKSSLLVDKIGYHDEYINGMKQALGVEMSDDLNTVSIANYAEYVADKTSSYSKNRIAVIYAEGDIIYGEGDLGKVGQGSINKSLRKARNDDKIKAIVLRINSPGGSALASELIWREIELTKKEKPVIVSMGDLAASGGYYIAANANKIFAEPTTITGSIGVFGLLPNGEQMANNIGINAEQVVTNKNAVTYSFFEPLNDAQRGFIKEGVLGVYDLFTKRVAEGRNLTREQVEAIAQGRVWTGADALNIGLVDALGGLDSALSHAADLVQIDDYTIKEFPVFERNLEKMLQDFGLVTSKENILRAEFGEENYKIIKQVKAMTDRKGIQLLFPFNTEIK